MPSLSRSSEPQHDYFCFICLEIFHDKGSVVRCPNWCETQGVSVQNLRGLNWDTDRVTICWYYELSLYVQRCLVWLRKPEQRRRWICERCTSYSTFNEGERRQCHRCGADYRWLTKMTWDRPSLASA